MSIDSVLSSILPEKPTMKVLASLHRVVPGAPKLHPYTSLSEAVRSMNPRASSRAKAIAHEMEKEQRFQDILRVSDLVDKGDGAYAAITGVRKTLGFFFNRKDGAGIDVNEQQRKDAVLKALAMGWMVHKGFDGSAKEKAEAFWSLPAGQSLALYFAAIEVALPFADELASGGASVFQGMMDREGGSQLKRLSMLGGFSGGDAGSMLSMLSGGLGEKIDLASKYVGPIAESAKSALPRVAQSADSITGVVATAADLLPVYRLLGARLAAEAIARAALVKDDRLG